MTTENDNQAGAFRVMQAKRDGLPAVIIFDAGLDPDLEQAAYPWLLTISIPIINPTPQGLCDPAEGARLDEVEDTLLDQLALEDYRYVGRVTWNGSRDVLIYVAEPEEILRSFEAEFERAAAETISIARRYDPTWEEYRRYLL